jgi:hypothetical protein
MWETAKSRKGLDKRLCLSARNGDQHLALNWRSYVGKSILRHKHILTNRSTTCRDVFPRFSRPYALALWLPSATGLCQVTTSRLETPQDGSSDDPYPQPRIFHAPRLPLLPCAFHLHIVAPGSITPLLVVLSLPSPTRLSPIILNPPIVRLIGTRHPCAGHSCISDEHLRPAATICNGGSPLLAPIFNLEDSLESGLAPRTQEPQSLL